MGFMDDSRKKLYVECRSKLITLKQERLNGLKESSSSLQEQITGDEGDMAQALQNQHIHMAQRERIISEIRQIDMALQRMEDGEYGVCEETGEPIEGPRLLAIPWTQVSLVGAEIREKRQKRFA
jgi:DnaK suppressor protein